MDKAIWDKIQERKELKAIKIKHDNARRAYLQLNIQIKRLCQKDKNNHLNKICKGRT